MTDQTFKPRHPVESRTQILLDTLEIEFHFQRTLTFS